MFLTPRLKLSRDDSAFCWAKPTLWNPAVSRSPTPNASWIAFPNLIHTPCLIVRILRTLFRPMLPGSARALLRPGPGRSIEDHRGDLGRLSEHDHVAGGDSGSSRPDSLRLSRFEIG